MGYNPLEAGLGLLPNAVATVPFAVIGSRLALRRGWRPVMVGSLIVMALGSALMAVVGSERSIWWIGVSFFVFGIGLGAGQSAPTQAIVDALPRAKQGVASAVNDASRELGAAVGIAIMGSAFNYAYRAQINDALAGVARPVVHAVRDSPAAGLQVAQHAGAGARRITEAIATATVSGWEAAFITVTVVFVGASLLIYLGTRRSAAQAVATA
jgi:MFS family permease